MPKTCSVCAHPGRDQIEAKLIEGKPYRDIADRFGASSSALFRHRQVHIPDRLVKAREAGEISKADTLVQQLEALQTKAKQILDKAESGGDLRTALAGVKELSRLIELVAKMTREQLRSDQAGTPTVELVDDATAKRMAEIFLDRCRKEQP